jgi:hypothetical protein
MDDVDADAEDDSDADDDDVCGCCKLAPDIDAERDAGKGRRLCSVEEEAVDSTCKLARWCPCAVAATCGRYEDGAGWTSGVIGGDGRVWMGGAIVTISLTSSSTTLLSLFIVVLILDTLTSAGASLRNGSRWRRISSSSMRRL